jgi:ATP-dependent DNA helicase RecG
MIDSFSLSSPVASLPGIGPVRKEQLERLGIETINDLLYYAPFRYEEIEQAKKISDLEEGKKATFKATVDSLLPIKTRRFKSMLKVKLFDESGKLDATWFNVPYVLSALKEGNDYYFTGKIGNYKGKLSVTNPTFEQSQPNTGSLVPIYHETAKLTSRWLRGIYKKLLPAIKATQLLTGDEAERAERLGFVDLKEALKGLHQPQSQEELKQAKKRLAFDEMFGLMRDVMESKQKFQQAKPVATLQVTNADIKKFFGMLPYEPTESQQQAVRAIALDLAQPHPMHRLLQGEVGSGKTTVAAFALWVAAQADQQAILICPTKILAEQHTLSLQKLLKDTGVKVGLVTGQTKEIDADILVGTHALFFRKDLKPSLVVIDEEQRFGVEQRQHFFRLKKKPHFLSMTATPIPRTVALTALADFDMSRIQPHRPPNTITTWVVKKQKRDGAYDWMRKQLNKKTDSTQVDFDGENQHQKSQAFVVCPFIDTSSIETLGSVKSANSEYKKLKKVFPEQNLILLHGRMSETEKSKVFTDMLNHKANLLVTTPVVEVGVDLPAVDMIVIEGAERFGMSQLHQLRGRVGRRGQQAYCLLFMSDDVEDAGSVTKRLEYFSIQFDGNALAEYDLKRRGSGELLGTRQHGFGNLQFASWFDSELIELCKKEIEK